MPVYLHPGVYVEEIASGARSIEASGTSIAAFVGYATKGPIGEPTYITKWDQYESHFGGLLDTIDFPTIASAPALGHAVRAFYLNGGGGAYVVRIVADGSAASSARSFIVPTGAGTTLPTSNRAITFTAVNEGEWGDALRVSVDEQDDGAFTLQIGLDEDGDINWIEKFEDLSFAPDGSDFASSVNNLSSLVTASVAATGDLSDDYVAYSRSGDLSAFTDFAGLEARDITITVDSAAPIEVTFAAGLGSLADVAAAIQAAIAPTHSEFTAEVSSNRLLLKSASLTFDSAVVVTDGSTDSALGDLLLGSSDGTEESTSDLLMPISIELTGGADGSAPASTDYDDAFTELENQKDVNIVCLPGQEWGTGNGTAIFEAAISHAEKMKNRLVLIDPPSGTRLITRANVEALGLSTSSYAAFYYPSIEIANPLYDAERNATTDTTLTVGPSGFLAGVYAKIDGRRGPWKAPAGTEAQLLGVSRFEYEVDDAAQDVLNPIGVNALRALSGYGNVVWGARTRATKADPPWRYVPVRRTAMMIEQSIFDSIQWAVFEPNNHKLWSGLRASIGGFMDGLFRAGAFQGETASQAYHVRCGLGDTMTQNDIDAGQVIVIVGFAALKPAEFVIIRIQQKTGQQ